MVIAGVGLYYCIKTSKEDEERVATIANNSADCALLESGGKPEAVSGNPFTSDVPPPAYPPLFPDDEKP